MPITYVVSYKRAQDSLWTSLPAQSQLSVNISALQAGTSYNFQVVASNGFGFSTPGTITSSTLPGTQESSEGFAVTSLDTPVVYASTTNRVAAGASLNQFYLHNTGTNNPQIAVTLSGGGTTYQGGLVSALVYHLDTLFQVNTSNNWYYWNTSTSDSTAGTQGWCRYQLNGAVSINGSTSITVAAGAAANTSMGTLAIPVFSNAANDAFPGVWGGTFTLGTGGDNASFYIIGNTLYAASQLSMTGQTYSISVTASLPVGGYNVGTSVTTLLQVTVVAITGITINPASPSFLTGVASGTQLATVTVTMSSGAFTGTLSVTPANYFQIPAGTTNLQTNDTPPANSYNVAITANQPGAGGSPFTATFPVLATSNTTINSITLNPASPSFTVGTAAGTQIATVTVNLSSGTFAGTLSVAPANYFQTPTATSLQIADTPPANPGYNVTITASGSGLTNSGYSQSFTVAAVTVSGAESVSDTVYTTSSVGMIYASQSMGYTTSTALDQFAITAAGAVTRNGQDSGAVAAAQIWYFKSYMTYQNTSQSWFYWDTTLTTPAWTAHPTSHPGLTGGAVLIINGTSVTMNVVFGVPQYTNIINSINNAHVTSITAALASNSPNNLVRITHGTGGTITLANGASSGTLVLTTLGLAAQTYTGSVDQSPTTTKPLQCTSVANPGINGLYVNQTAPGMIGTSAISPASTGANLTTGPDAALFTAEAGWINWFHIAQGVSLQAGKTYSFGVRGCPNYPSLCGNRTGGPWNWGPPTTQTFTGLVLSNNTFVGSTTVQVPVGKLSAIMNGGPFLGIYSITGGTDATSFSIGGTKSNILFAKVNTGTSGSTTLDGTYTVTVTASQTGVTTSRVVTFTLNSYASTNPLAWICTPPAQAAAAGLTVLSLYDDFTSSSTILAGASSSPGYPMPSAYKWFADGTNFTMTTNNTATDVSTSNICVNPSWMPYDASMQSVGVAATADTNHGGTGRNYSPVGGIVRTQGGGNNSTILSISEGYLCLPNIGIYQSGYYECAIQFKASAFTAQNCSYGWPAMWMWSIEDLRGHGNGGSGFSAGYTEIDVMEYAVASTGAWGGSAYHGTSPGGSGWGIGGGWPDNEWHTYGWLWNPSSNATRFYKDEVAMGTTNGTAPAQLQSQHVFVMLGSGTATAVGPLGGATAPPPTYFDWCRVWESP